MFLRACTTRVGPLRKVLSLVFRVRRLLCWACIVAEDLCCSPAICLLCVLTLGVTQVTVAWKPPRELYRSHLYGTCKNTASSFKAHLRANHLSALGNSLILGRELLTVQPVGQGQIVFTRPLYTSYGICMNDGFSWTCFVSSQRRGWPCGCPPKRTARGCGANALSDPQILFGVGLL